MAIKGKTVPSDAFLFTKRERPDFHSRETRLAALRLFEAGVGYVNASVKLGISMNTVRDWSRKYRKGTFEVDVPEKCFYYTKAVKRRIVKLRAKGLTWKELEEPAASGCGRPQRQRRRKRPSRRIPWSG